MKEYASQRICVFGDSIPWGAEDQERGGWVDRLKVFVKRTGKFHEVFNLANPGKTTEYLVERMDFECESRMNPQMRKVNAVLVQIGINDSQWIDLEKRNRIEMGTTKRNIRKIAEIAKKYVDNVVFVGLTHVDEKRTTPFDWSDDKHQMLEDVKKYNYAIKSVCKKEKVHFLDVFELLNDDDLQDGLHPNEKGHEKLFLAVKEFLIDRKIITELA